MAGQGFVLPERILEEKTGKPSYIISFGLLTIDRSYQQGLETLFRFVSLVHFDRNYNANRMEYRNDLEIIEGFDPVIYIVCRTSHLDIYQSKGFDAVKNQNGKLVKTSDGLNLLRMSGKDFLVRYSRYSFQPHLKVENVSGEMMTLASREDRANYFLSLEKRANIVSDKWQYYEALLRVNLAYEALLAKGPDALIPEAMMSFLNAIGRGQNLLEEIKYKAYRAFLEELYIFGYSNHDFLSKESRQLLPFPKADLFIYEQVLMLPDSEVAFELYQDLVRGNLYFPKLYREDELQYLLHLIGEH